MTRILRECIVPVEEKFSSAFTKIETHESGDFLALQQIKSVNSAGQSPLTQRVMVEGENICPMSPSARRFTLNFSGGTESAPAESPFVWWRVLLEEVPNFTPTTKIDKQHKGFKRMVSTAKRYKLVFQDIHQKGANSTDGTWAGIKDIHNYGFVFLCFMHAYGKKIVDPLFHRKVTMSSSQKPNNNLTIIMTCCV